ncbi:DNA mismatch endonuclease Vsr [Massilia solisilvae]|uniref:Very short patch repair endonuclease n=1 Tax=Massilia solisilvae TaxID=1811225 RepID=A0ABT2BPC2_9BURK|nr:DNA mismatch endonuclease Vsr [Massilia solisilvae]MCS0610360.1 DNA mismatch endonuclease Vsr [Massilia solisilvae]
MDVVDPAKRSQMMAGIRSKNTLPEMVVRRFLHARGFRYRLHARNLPGSPDLALSKYKVAIFVHGCFWHRHPSCKYATTPSSNTERWLHKFRQNVARDTRDMAALSAFGWRVITVWECELRREGENRLERLIAEIQRSSP